MALSSIYLNANEKGPAFLPAPEEPSWLCYFRFFLPLPILMALVVSVSASQPLSGR